MIKRFKMVAVTYRYSKLDHVCVLNACCLCIVVSRSRVSYCVSHAYLQVRVLLSYEYLK